MRSLNGLEKRSKRTLQVSNPAGLFIDSAFALPERDVLLNFKLKGSWGVGWFYRLWPPSIAGA